jgi:DNA-directed RNA polymerase specialized sigma24 family protein
MSELVVALANGRELSSEAHTIVNSAITGLIRKEFARADADDVAQETMKQLLRSKPNPESPTGYVFTIARREALKWLRKAPRVAELDESTTPADAGDDAISALLDRAAGKQEVVAAMRVLIEAGDADEVGCSPKPASMTSCAP